MNKLTEDWYCPDCGADNTFTADRLCDTCLLVFYFDDPTAKPFEYEAGNNNE
jgi:NMD protein affecting ribosome stability and mRNA decay